jgi:hypothetical protein
MVASGDCVQRNVIVVVLRYRIVERRGTKVPSVRSLGWHQTSNREVDFWSQSNA